MAVSRRRSDEDHYNSGDLGYYSRTNLNDMINNFIVAYVGEGKVLRKVNRHEVAFWAQRTVQEFNYDVFHSDNSIELEVGPSNTILLPSDFVNYRKLTYTDTEGRQQDLQPAQRTEANKSVVQDQNYDYVYDENGDIVIAQDSETAKRFQASDTDLVDGQIVQSYFYQGGFNANGEDFDSFYSKLYGLTPSDTNVNAEFLFDLNKGVIYLSSQVTQDDLITLYYTSDGLGDNGDFTNVYVPKLAEEAVYANILAKLSSVMESTVQVAPLYVKKAKAAMNTAKIRLMDLRPTELKTVLRNKHKWIKH